MTMKDSATLAAQAFIRESGKNALEYALHYQREFERLGNAPAAASCKRIVEAIRVETA